MELINTNILEKLNDTSVDFATRCNIAQGSLEKFDNEELILDWIASNAKKPLDEYTCCLKVLLKCLQSQHLASLLKSVSPESCLNFLKKSNKFQLDDGLQVQVRDATKLLMSIPCFQLNFKTNVKSLAKCVCVHYSAISVCGHCEGEKCGNCPELLSQLYNETLLKDDFVIQFLDNMMPAVFSLSPKICKCSISYQMNKLITQMFFKDTRILAEVTSLDRYLTDPANLASDCPIIVQALIRTITQSVVTVKDDAMAMFFASFLSIFMKNIKSDDLKLFVSLASAIGFKYEQDEIQLQHKVDCQKGLKILLAMLNQLSDSCDKAQLKENIACWLISLLKLIMSPTYGLTKYTLGIIQGVIYCTPLVILKVIPQFVQYVMMVPKDNDTKPLYISILHSVMEIFIVLSYLPKMFDEVIDAIYMQAVSNPVMLPPCSIMLPKTFLTIFEHLVTTTRSTQFLKVIMCLLTLLDKKIAEPLTICKEKIDAGGLIVLEFITTLLECVLQNTVLTTKEHYQLLAYMASVLQKIGLAMIKQTFNVMFINLFLKLCRVWGDAILLIKNYDGSNEFEDILIDHVGDYFEIEINNHWTDISHTFKFLTSFNWKIICERVQRFVSKQSTDDFCSIVLQNLVALHSADVLTQEKTDCTVVELLQIARTKWLWENITVLKSHIHTEKMMLRLAAVLTDTELTMDVLVTQIKKLCLLENSKISDRMFMSAIALSWLNKIANVLNSQGMTKTQDLLPGMKQRKAIIASEDIYGSFLDVQANEDYQHSKLLTSVVSDKMKMAKQSDKMSKQFVGELANVKSFEDINESDFLKIQKYLNLLIALKVTSLSPPFCRIVLLALLSVLNEIKQQNRKPPNMLFNIISDIFLKHIHIIGDMWLNKEFFLWLYAAYNEHPQKKGIFSLACDFIVKNPKANELTDILAADLELVPLVILACIKQKQNSKRKRENSEEDLQQAIKFFLDKFTDIAFNHLKQFIQNKGVQEEQLHTYCLLLKHYVHTKNEEKILDCSQHLAAFYDIVLSTLTDPTIVDISNQLLFIEILFSSRTFQDKMQPGTHLTLWKALAAKASASKHCMQVLLEAFTIEEYNDVLEAMKTETLKNNTVDINLLALHEAWIIIIIAKVNAEKIKRRQTYKDFLEQEFSSLAARWVTDPPDTARVIAVFSVLRSFVKTPSIRMGPENLDVIFLLMSVLPSDDLNAIEKGLNLLGNLLLKRSVVVFMHLPSFLQRFRFFISSIIKASQNGLEEDEVTTLNNCAISIEKLSSLMVTHKTELTPSAPNLIADIINFFEGETVHPIVKKSLQQAINHLFTLCSQKHIDHLMQSLSPASREIFKIYYKNYNKYCRYHGKV